MIVDPVPPALGERWTSHVPTDADIDPVLDLMLVERRRFEPDAVIQREQIARALVGHLSWSKRQLVIASAHQDEANQIANPIAWVSCEDRSAGRTDVDWVVDPDAEGRDDLVNALLDWASEVGGQFARHRGTTHTQLDADCDERDTERQRLLAEHGYQMVRTWLHMERPVRADEATTTPEPRPGVRVRPVATHASGMPVAQDVRTVHRMLEESFQDHFNSYRESFPEFEARMQASADDAWDHWWIAEVQNEDGTWLPGGGLVASTMPATRTAGEGTYLEYLGVHRSARGRGIAKALLNTAIRDAAERGRTRVGLEVDADSPTGADGLYASMGWVTTSRTQSWHSNADQQPSRLLEPME